MADRLAQFVGDVSMFNADRVTPEGFMTQRLKERDERFGVISEEVNERVPKVVSLAEAAQ